MNRFQANDLRDLIKEVVSSYQKEKLKWLLEQPEPLEEGVFDPQILKCIFMAGGPGSGKSFVADSLLGQHAEVIFGLRKEAGDKSIFANASFLPGGMKYVNSDRLFEKALADAGIDTGDLEQIYKDNPSRYDAQITGAPDPEQPYNPASIRTVEKDRLKKLRAPYEVERLGLLVDGTGKSRKKITGQNERAKAQGYDTYMIFVDTTLEVAKERNQKRARTLPEEGPDGLIAMWEACQVNLEYYQQLFGKNFALVNNNVYGPPPEEIQAAVESFVDSPVENPLGQEWIEGELERRGVATLEPGGATGFRGSKKSADTIQKMRQAASPPPPVTRKPTP
jgi:hypothetical protein